MTAGTDTFYPLRFEPIFQYRLWGGRRLSGLLSTPLPGTDPIGEAWVLSDRDDFASRVSDGPFRGKTITQLMGQFPEQMMGSLASTYRRFPLLLKFLDAREMLSVQVHPADWQKDLLPPGEQGKTEAWVVLESDPGSTIYAGLAPGTTPDQLRSAIVNQSVEGVLNGFNPKVGDGVFIRSGTVHALGGGVMVFEVQENSDVTFRLFDWGRVDGKTGQPRELHVDKALACIDFEEGPVGPVDPVADSTGGVSREQMFKCEHFCLWRIRSQDRFVVGSTDEPSVLVSIEGDGLVEHEGTEYPIVKGDVMLLPAAVGACTFQPTPMINLLEISLPDQS